MLNDISYRRNWLMSEKSKDAESYKIKLTGLGVTIERPVSEAVARKVAAIIMGGGGASVESSGEREGHLGGDGDVDANISSKAFMTQKHPKTDMERITCLAYYLTHNKGI